MYSNGSLGTIAVFDVSIGEAPGAPMTSPLNDMALLDRMCTDIIGECGLTIISSQRHQFEPYGITMLYLLSESHLSIHTWPENSCFAMDVHSCQSDIDVEKIKATLGRYLATKDIRHHFIKRGV